MAVDRLVRNGIGQEIGRAQDRRAFTPLASTPQHHCHGRTCTRKCLRQSDTAPRHGADCDEAKVEQ